MILRNGCHDLMMLCLNISDVAIIICLCLKIVSIYKIHTKKINIKNQIRYPYENLIKPKNLEIRNIFIDKKSYKVLIILISQQYVKSVL